MSKDRQGAAMRADAAASAPVVGVILLVAIGVAMAVLVALLSQEAGDTAADPSFPNAAASSSNAPTLGLDDAVVQMEHKGGRCIPVDDFTFQLRGAISGVVTLEPDHPSPGWCVGETLALDEADAADLIGLDSGSRLQLIVINERAESIVFDREVELA